MNDKELLKNIRKGCIFIYPTDTVYGLGCDAFNLKAVDKIKSIKKRDKDKPLSVIVPSKKWIEDNLIIDNIDLDKYLPGPYTIVLKKKDKGFLEHVSSGDSLGVRIPSSEFCDRVRKSGVAFITTSVNLSGESPVKSVDEVSSLILEKVDEVVDGGVLDGRASTLIIGEREVER